MTVDRSPVTPMNTATETQRHRENGNSSVSLCLCGLPHFLTC